MPHNQAYLQAEKKIEEAMSWQKQFRPALLLRKMVDAGYLERDQDEGFIAISVSFAGSKNKIYAT